jgi:hypothetical protein
MRKPKDGSVFFFWLSGLASPKAIRGAKRKLGEKAGGEANRFGF